MPQVPPPPVRNDSLPSAASGSSGTAPAVPQLPGQPVRRSSSGSRNTRSRQTENIAKPSMAVSQTRPVVQVDPPCVSVFEATSHTQDCFRALYELYQNQELCDVEICCGKKSFKCHRAVLACSSMYFRAMFKSEMAESRQEIVTIQDIDDDAMEKLIEFTYTARIGITVNTVHPLLYAASILQIDSVAGACAEFMKSHLHPCNCIEVRTFAELHNRVELLSMTDEYILDQFLEVSNTEDFMRMPIKMLETYISSDHLNVNEESQVFEAVMKWIKHDPETRQEHLAKLMGLVRLPLLDMAYLKENVEKEELVRKNLECRDFLDEAKYFQMSLVSLVPDVNKSRRMRPRESYAGVLFCVGGRGSTGDPFRTVECYDPRKKEWFSVCEMITRRRHVGVCSANGLLYAVGGHDGSEHLCSGEVFDPKTNRWRSIASMGSMRRGLALACLGGPIYAVGGLDDSTCYSAVERYDPATDTWTFVASMNTPRGGVGLAALKGHLYAVGGNDGVSSLDRCERYDAYLNKWSPIANMFKRRAGAGCTVLDGFVYVVGGFDDCAPLDTVERYDPKTNEWTLVSSMNVCRGGVGLGSLGRKLFAIGGHDSHNYLNSVECYDPETDKWETAPSINQYRAGAGVAFCSTPSRFVICTPPGTLATPEELRCV